MVEGVGGEGGGTCIKPTQECKELRGERSFDSLNTCGARDEFMEPYYHCVS